MLVKVDCENISTQIISFQYLRAIHLQVHLNPFQSRLLTQNKLYFSSKVKVLTPSFSLFQLKATKYHAKYMTS